MNLAWLKPANRAASYGLAVAVVGLMVWQQFLLLRAWRNAASAGQTATRLQLEVSALKISTTEHTKHTKGVTE